MTPRDRDGSFTHTHGVMHLFPTGVKKVNGGMAWFLRKPCFLLPMYQRFKLDPTEVSKKGGILLANLLHSSRSTFSCASFPSLFAFQEGICEAQISALGGSPTVSGGFSRPSLRRV